MKQNQVKKSEVNFQELIIYFIHSTGTHRPRRYLAGNYTTLMRKGKLLDRFLSDSEYYVLAHMDDIQSKMKVLYPIGHGHASTALPRDQLFTFMPAGGFVVDEDAAVPENSNHNKATVYLVDTERGLVHRFDYVARLSPRNEEEDKLKYLEMHSEEMWNFFQCDAPEQEGVPNGEWHSPIFKNFK